MTDVRQTDDGLCCTPSRPPISTFRTIGAGATQGSWHMPDAMPARRPLEIWLGRTTRPYAPFETMVPGFLPSKLAGARLSRCPARISHATIADATILAVDPDLADPKTFTVSVIDASAPCWPTA